MFRVPKSKEARMKWREIYVPKGATPDPRNSEAAAVFLYETAGKAYAMGFNGTAGKPSFHHSYRSPESREEHVTKFFEAVKSSKEYKAKRAAARKAYTHTLTVGDILHTSWGYDQTNVSFFEVTRIVSGKSVGVRKIRSEMVEATGPFSSSVRGVRGAFIGEEIVRRVAEGNAVLNAEYSYAAHPGAGPTHSSWGH